MMPEPAGGGEEKGPQDRGRNQEDQTRAIPEGELSELSQEAFEYDDNTGILDEYHKMRVSFIYQQKGEKNRGRERERERKGGKLSVKLFTSQSS